MVHHDASGRGGLPILIANGFAPFSIPLHLVRRQYRSYGFQSRVIPYRSEDMRDVEAFAEHVAQYVENYCREKGLAKVNLMGVSLGGIAGLAAIKRHDIARRVATFAAIGAPFRGVTWSWTGVVSVYYATLGRQLAPHSSYVRELQRIPLPAGPHYVAVSGRHDFVCPPWTSELMDGIDLLLPTSHIGTVCDPRIAAAVVPHLG